MSKKMFHNLQVLRDKCSSVEEFAALLITMTKGKTAIGTPSSKRRESRAGNTYWEWKIESDFIRPDTEHIWFAKRGYLRYDSLVNWYIRIKDA
jgi:hypothetical protein